MRRPRRNHSAKFKAQVAREAMRGEKTIAEIAAHHEVHPNQVTASESELHANTAAVFGGELLRRTVRSVSGGVAREDGQLAVERGFLEGALGRFPGLSGKR